MENRKKIFGVNRNIVLFFHKIMLFGVLHMSFVAPSQTMINDYFNTEVHLRYLGSSLTHRLEINNDVKEAGDSSTKKSFFNPIQLQKNKWYIHDEKEAPNYTIKSDLEIGVIGVTKENPLDNASDNIFKFSIAKLPNSKSRVYLSYDLYGVQDFNAVARSINQRLSTGGYIVKQQQGWTKQKEEINPNWLKVGENILLFSIPNGANYQYKIKNLKLEVVNYTSNKLTPLLTLNSPTVTFEKDNQIYIKGFVRNDAAKDIKIYAEEQLLTCRDGEFEGFITLTETLKNKKFVVVKAIDAKGLIGQEVVTFDFLNEADKLFPVETTIDKVVSLFNPTTSNTLQTEGAAITIKEGALKEPKEISIVKLRPVDIPPMGSGMLNVTKGGLAYRFLPDGTQFEKPVHLAIGYDEKKLPKGYSTKDIKTFYFNLKSKSWVAVKRDSIDEKEKLILVSTNHFTDYINGIIQTPESPQTAGFTPTMMNDIKAADPSSEMTIISPPEVSQKGDANISYPINIPSGRKGMQPKIALQYSNEGGNGWLGKGWGLTTPSISIDTRWGVPQLDPVNETEIYTLNGEQLMYPKIDAPNGSKNDWMPNRHYDVPTGNSTLYNTTPRARITDAVFTPRKQGSFAVIIRHGDAPTNYYWEVTGTDGTKNWYGGDSKGINENAIIRVPGNVQNTNIVHWGLYKTEDVFGNYVIYKYTNTFLSGVSGSDANLIDGKIFNIAEIFYTGYEDNYGNYSVFFKTDNQIRQDVTINARLGLKQIEPYRLNKIIVNYKDQPIRSYRFNYSEGVFGKSLLKDLSEYEGDSDVSEMFHKHTFEYYDDIVDIKGNVANAISPYSYDVPINPSPSYTLLNTNNLLHPSAANSNETIQWDWGVRPAVGIDLLEVSNDPAQLFTVGTHLGESYKNSKGKITMIDIDGNGLEDVVYRSDDNLYYLPHFKNINGNDVFNSQRNILNINNFYRNNGLTQTIFGDSWDISFLWDGYFGSKRFKSFEDTDIYFTDGNDDGLPDIVNDNKVYFNKPDSNGNIEYETGSQNTPNMVITANTNFIAGTDLPDTDPVPANNYDVVRVWEAPKEGIISITDSVTFASATPSDQLTYSIETRLGDSCQPFRIYLKQFTNTITTDNITITNYSGNNPALGYSNVSSCNPQNNSYGLHVYEGQKIFFREHKTAVGNNQVLNTNPKITYLENYNSPYPSNNMDANGNNLNAIEYNDAFILSESQTANVGKTGTYSINWNTINVANLSDSITFKIEKIRTEPNHQKFTTTIFEKKCLQGTTCHVETTDNIVLPFYDVTNMVYTTIPAGQKNEYKFSVISDSNVNWKSIDWKPSFEYTPDTNGATNGATSGTTKTYPIVLYDIYREKNCDFLNTNTSTNYPSFNTAGDQTYSVLPRFNQMAGANNLLTVSDNGSFLFLVKKDGLTIGKITVKIIGGVISLVPVYGGTIPIIFSANMASTNKISYEFVVNDNTLFDKYNHDVTFGTAPNNYGYKNVILGSGSFTYNDNTLTPALSSNYYVFCNSTTLYRTEPHLGSMYRDWGQFLYNSDADLPITMPHDTVSTLINNSIVNDPYGASLIYIANVLGVNLSGCQFTDPIQQQNCMTYQINSSLNLPPAGTVNSGNIEQIVTNLQVNLATNGVTPKPPAFMKMNAYRAGNCNNPYYSNSVLKSELLPPPTTTCEERWIGFFDSMYSSATAMRDGNFTDSSSSQLIVGTDTDSALLQGNLDTGMGAITKEHRSSSRSYTGGWGSTNASYSSSNHQGGSGYSNSVSDFIDMNGDGYPDLVTSNQIQSTNMTGGHITPVNHSFGDISVSDSYNLVATTSGGSIISGLKQIGNQLSINSTPALNQLSQSLGNAADFSSVSANLLGQDEELVSWMDINGDGLTDRVIESNGFKYQLNLGKNSTNGIFENFSFLENSTTKPSPLGLGLNLPISNYTNLPFSLSVGASSNSSNSTIAFHDINGDGLVDLLEVPTNGDSATVRYNLGNKFSTVAMPVLNTAANSNNNTSFYISGSKAYFFGFSICCWILPIIYLKFGATASASASLTVSDVKKSYKDFNGDGYLDYLETTDTNIKVYPSQIGATNMLKRVTNPLGGQFEITYNVQPVDYNNPHAKWVMSGLVMKDGYDKVNDGKDSYLKSFVYEKGKYDRRERDFYGYETVKELDYNVDATNAPTTVYRTSVSKYHNESYFLNGLLKESYVLKGNTNQLFSKTENTYQIKELDANDNNKLKTPQVTLPNNFDVGGTEGRRSAAVVMTMTKNYLYELNSSPQITSEVNMEYDDKGRVVTYTNIGDINITNDNYSSTISYHTLSNNILNVPKEINVSTSSGGTVRTRSTVVSNVSTGTIDKIIAQTGGTPATAETNLKYDTYGNLTNIIYPPNNNPSPQSMSYKYDYDQDNYKYVIKITDAFGYSSSATYDPKFDKALETIDMAGNHMVYEYDHFGRNTLIRAPKEIAANKEYTLKFQYFPYFSNLTAPGNVTALNFVPVALTQHYDQQHPDNPIETYTFIDGLARPIQIKKDIVLNQSESHHDLEYIEALSISGKSTYDSFGRVIQQFHPWWEQKFDSTRFLLNEQDTNLHSSTTLDELDRPIASVDPAGNTSTMEYSLGQDNGGTMAVKTRSTVDQGGQDIVTETYKDVRGKVIATMNVGGLVGSIWTHFNYDEIGQLVTYTDAEGLATTNTYDLLGRKVTVTHPDNGQTKFQYDGANNLISLQTNNLLNSGGLFVTYDYDHNRLSHIEYPVNPDGSTNSSNVDYVYGIAGAGNDTGRLVWQKDATGLQTFKYGNMGEMTHNTRTVVAPTPDMPVRIFNTDYEYDSWNRLMLMAYPDGEKVTYNYDLGGNLTRMTGQVAEHPYNYIDRIDYDYYEQRAYLLYGNRTETYYEYTPELRRLQNLNVKTADQNDLYNNNYLYDNVGNVKSITNTAGITANNMGGGYSHEFRYDNLNRLIKANGHYLGSIAQQVDNNDFQSDYSLDIGYNDTHGIINKTQNHYKNFDTTPFAPNTYINNYNYLNGTHMVGSVSDGNTGNTENFKYDSNGNLINKTNVDGSVRQLFWDESNRLRVVMDDQTMQHYVYDAKGERILKASSDIESVFDNGSLSSPSTVTMNSYATYPSAFLVIDPQGIYSKHYYAGSQRIVSRIGEKEITIFSPNDPIPVTDPVATPSPCTGCKQRSDLKFDPKALQELQRKDLQQFLDKAKKGKVRFNAYKVYSYEAAQATVLDDAPEDNRPGHNEYPPVYFYHPDHLGTSTALTDFNGSAYQFFLNLPFGEMMAEQKGTMYYNSPYKFNGKELDEETGLYYYGARYYDPRASIWLSVDPLFEKYPNVNPYVYCVQNPLNLIDPDGKAPTPPDDHFDAYGNFMYRDTKSTNNIIVHHANTIFVPGTQLKDVKFDNSNYATLSKIAEHYSKDASVDMSKLHNQKISVSNAIFFEHKGGQDRYTTDNYNDGVDSLPDVYGNETLMNTSNSTVTINLLNGKIDPLLNDSGNLTATLDHEGGAIGHLQNPDKKHSQIYSDQLKKYDKKITKEYKEHLKTNQKQYQKKGE